MSCQDFTEALVDERLPRPPGLQAHLEHCPECRALARLHASASTLRLAEPPAPAPIPREAVLGVVRRRQHRRRIVASTAATAALATLVLLVTPHLESRVPVSDGPLVPSSELSLKVATPVEQPAEAAQGEPASLGLLMAEVHGYTRTNPSVEDETYRSFGALAAWVRPPDSSLTSAHSPSSHSVK